MSIGDELQKNEEAARARGTMVYERWKMAFSGARRTADVRSALATAYDAIWHPTVGRLFTGPGGGKFRCTSYDPDHGFWMRHESGPTGYGEMPPGSKSCVSERAIGRTFHRVYLDTTYLEHDAECRCRCCVSFTD